MDTEFVAKRITQLREQRGTSARDMSLSLGQNVNYINRIENGKSLPSLRAFFWICEYFGVTPSEFFDEETAAPVKVQELVDTVRGLDYKELDDLIAIAKRFRR